MDEMITPDIGVSSNLPNGVVLPPSEPVKKQRKLLKIVLIVIGVLVTLILLLIIFSSISRYQEIKNFKQEYQLAVERCGKKPIMKVHTHGWKTNRTEIITPEGLNYDTVIRNNEYFLGDLFIENEVQEYYCSLEEAGFDPVTGKNADGVGFGTGSNFSEKQQIALAKKVVDSYQLANSIALLQPLMTPAQFTNVILKIDGAYSGTQAPYSVKYQTSDESILADIEYSCGDSQKAMLGRSNLSHTESLQTDSSYKSIDLDKSGMNFVSYKVKSAFYGRDNNGYQQWKINIDFGTKNGPGFAYCVLEDYESKLTREDGESMITEFKLLDVNNFDSVKYLN